MLARASAHTQVLTTGFRAPSAASRPSAPASAAESLAEALGLMGAAMPFARNTEIYGEGEPADYLYKLTRGAVRTYKLLDDGRRQIGAFYLPGDVFGLEIGAEHRFAAEAIVDSTVVVVKRTAVMTLADRQYEVARELWAMTARELAQAQNLTLTLGRKNAQERVAAFLLEMAGRSSDRATVELPMSRHDIADHLGLTTETVSRTLTQLENAAAIVLPTSRRVVLRNRAALERLNT